MSFPCLILVMIFLHIVDDFYLQGWLASAKQKDWWKSNAPHPLYRYDYICALVMHSFSWAFMIMLPTLIIQKFEPQVEWYLIFAQNVMFHAVIDNEKANSKTINLITDQFIHILQILATALALR